MSALLSYIRIAKNILGFYDEPINGWNITWERHQFWRGRYDFIVATEPYLYASREIKLSGSTYRTSLLDVGGSVFFTSFRWRDSLGKQREITREELIAVFDQLVKRWEVAYYAQHLLSHDLQLELPKYMKNDAQDSTLKSKIACLIKSLEPYVNERFKLINSLASYLNKLADFERSGYAPPNWCRYRRRVTLTEPFATATVTRDATTEVETLDDYAFRLTFLLRSITFREDNVYDQLEQDAQEIHNMVTSRRLLSTKQPHSEVSQEHDPSVTNLPTASQKHLMITG